MSSADIVTIIDDYDEDEDDDLAENDDDDDHGENDDTNEDVVAVLSSYPAAISLVASGRVDPSPLITTKFDLTEVVDAFQLARQTQEGVLKVMIRCN